MIRLASASGIIVIIYKKPSLKKNPYWKLLKKKWVMNELERERE